MDFFLLFACGLLIGAIYLFVNTKQKKTDHGPNAIDQIPTVPTDSSGHLNAIGKAGGMLPFVRNLHNNCGSVVKFYLGPVSNQSLVVSLNDPVLFKKTLKITSRPIDMFKFLEPLFPEEYDLQIMAGERAVKLRKVYQASVSHQVLTAKYKSIASVVEELVEKWKKLPEGSTVKLEEYLFEVGMKAIVKTSLSSELVESIDMTRFNHAYDVAMNGLFDKQFGQGNVHSEEEIKKNVEYINSVYAQIIAKRKGMTTDVEPDFFDMLMNFIDPKTGEKFPTEGISNQLSSQMLAAYHTTAIAVLWTLFLLLQHPSILKKAQDEVDEVLKGKAPVMEDLDKLPYLLQVLKESLRVYSPGPFAARILEEELEIGGYVLPKGTTLFYPLGIVHFNPKYWPNPEKFDPDRFGPQNAKNINNSAFVPFGIGARICTGERLAWLEMKMIMAAILQNFNLELVTKPQDVVPVERFVLLPKDDIAVKIFPRK